MEDGRSINLNPVEGDKEALSLIFRGKSENVKFGDYYEELVIKIKDAFIKNIDETSWRINGKNNWLWLFINKEVALYIVDKKRNSKVPIKTLGNQEGKIIIEDRFSAYNELAKISGCKQQICWAHLLRNSKDLAEHYSEAKYIHK